MGSIPRGPVETPWKKGDSKHPCQHMNTDTLQTVTLRSDAPKSRAGRKKVKLTAQELGRIARNRSYRSRNHFGGQGGRRA